MSNIILVFIDSFPFEFLEAMSFLSQFRRCQIKCGLGYSVNIKAELFAGLRPDDLGYFNEWTFDLSSYFRRHAWWLRFLQPLCGIYLADRFTHRVFERFVFRQGLINIPFVYLPYFTHMGVPPYHPDFGFPSLFSQTRNLIMIRYMDFPPSPRRDEQVLQRALEIIPSAPEGPVFVAWADLDAYTHVHGMGSEPHLTRIRQLDAMVEECVAAFWKRYPGGHFVFVSDHSMANTSQAIEIMPEALFGPASLESYLYFTDSTILRVWVFDDDLRPRIETHLQESDVGILLTSCERNSFGVTQSRFGDFIFVLHEGIVLGHSFWGRKLPAAMHGYHPDTFSQKGCLVSDLPCFPEAHVPTSLDVYAWLQGQLCAP